MTAECRPFAPHCCWRINTRDETRTRITLACWGILSPLRLPIPPPGPGAIATQIYTIEQPRGDWSRRRRSPWIAACGSGSPRATGAGRVPHRTRKIETMHDAWNGGGHTEVRRNESAVTWLVNLEDLNLPVGAVVACCSPAMSKSEHAMRSTANLRGRAWTTSGEGDCDLRGAR
jgi:hypothetical protein